MLEEKKASTMPVSRDIVDASRRASLSDRLAPRFTGGAFKIGERPSRRARRHSKAECLRPGVRDAWALVVRWSTSAPSLLDKRAAQTQAPHKVSAAFELSDRVAQCSERGRQSA